MIESTQPATADGYGVRTWLITRLLGISPLEASVDRRGFAVERQDVRDRLETIGRAFLRGYNLALAEPNTADLAHRLDRVEIETRGFAYEGAAMGLALLGFVMPWRRRSLPNFLEQAGAPHVYMAHVGIGWALAALRLRLDPTLARLDPLLAWLVIDGFGFYHGYFHWRRHIRRHAVPRRLHGYGRRVFDQGLGRSLWFVAGADPIAVASAIQAFPHVRWADLWSGAGLACAYAGGVGGQAISTLMAAAGAYRPHVAQGVCFAAKARSRAGNPAAHTALACDVVWGLPAETVAAISDQALDGVPRREREHAYEMWRTRIRVRFMNGSAS